MLNNFTVENMEVKVLNNIRVADLMTTSTSQSLSGVMTFESLNIGDVTMDDRFTVNGLRIPADVVTRTGKYLLLHTHKSSVA